MSFLSRITVAITVLPLEPPEFVNPSKQIQMFENGIVLTYEPRLVAVMRMTKTETMRTRLSSQLDV